MAVTQNPAAILIIGFNSKTLSGYCPTGVTLRHGADIEHHVCNGEFKTSTIKNKSHTISFTANVLTGTSLTAIVAGDIFTIDSIVYLATSVNVELQDTVSRITLEGIKHADAAYA